MSTFNKIAPAFLLVSLNFAHATPDATGNLDVGHGRPASQATKTAPCDGKLAFPAIDGLRALVPVKAPDSFTDVTVNYPIQVARAGAGLLGPARDQAQRDMAIKGGELLAAEILKIQNLDREEFTVEATKIIGQIGFIPKNALDGFADLLSKSVSSLESPQGEDFEFNKDTKNALGELTRVVTSFRKNAFDVNWLTNLMFKIGFKDQSSYIRNNFQSIKDQARAIDATLETAIALMIKRHYQMLDGRVQLKDLERYAELATMMGQETQRLLEEYMVTNNFSDVQRATFIKNVMTPLSDRLIALTKTRSTLALSYAQFTLIMDGNQSLFSMISNIRETASLEITVFGAAKSATVELEEIANIGRATVDAFDQMRVESIDQLKKFGVKMREIPGRTIRSMEVAVKQIDQLENELTVSQDFRLNTIQRYKDAMAIIIPKLNDVAARADQGFVKVGSLIKSTDKDLAAQGADRKDYDWMPTVKQIEAPKAD